MPKENTHLFFAEQVLKAIKEKDIKSDVSLNIYYYYLGSVVLDAFYYTSQDKIRMVSEKIHGQSGYLSHKIIFKFLDLTKDKKNLVFVYGCLTHRCLDMTFHPVIDFLAMNYSDKSLSPMGGPQYIHRYIETYIDNLLNPIFLMPKLVKPSLVEHLTFPQIISDEFGLPAFQVKRALRRQLISNILFKSKAVFEIVYALNKLNLLKDKSILGLFYGNLKRGESVIKATISSKDLITKEINLSSINSLLSTALQAAREMIKAVYDCYSGRMTKEECGKIISAKRRYNPKNFKAKTSV